MCKVMFYVLIPKAYNLNLTLTEKLTSVASIKSSFHIYYAYIRLKQNHACPYSRFIHIHTHSFFVLFCFRFLIVWIDFGSWPTQFSWRHIKKHPNYYFQQKAVCVCVCDDKIKTKNCASRRR